MIDNKEEEKQENWVNDNKYPKSTFGLEKEQHL